MKIEVVVAAPAKGSWTGVDVGGALTVRAAVKLAGSAQVALKDAPVVGGKPKATIEGFPAAIEGSLAVARLVLREKLEGMAAMPRARIEEWLALADRAALAATVAAAPVAGDAVPSVAKEDEPRVAVAALGDLVAVLAPVERHLATNTFLEGERLSLADVAVACAVAKAFALVVDPATRASKLMHTTRWLELVTAQECVASVLPVSPFVLCAAVPKMLVGVKVQPAGAGKKASSAPASTPANGPVATMGSSPTTTGAVLFSRGRTRVKELLSSSAVGSTATVCGWVRTIRETGSGEKALVFVELNDGSSPKAVQVVCVRNENGLAPADVDALLACGGIGASLRVEGLLVESPAKGQRVEVRASKITVLGDVPDPMHYPLAKSKTGHTVEYLRTILHLRPRTNLISSVARVRHAAAMAVHNFFNKLGFLYVHTPIITTADCEGAGEMFQVTTLMDAAKGTPAPLAADGKVDYKQDFFGRPAYLTVSGQLQGECYATALSDIYTFGPTFRAENSNTTRHLAEFWMIEPEMCFAGLKEDMDLAEDFVKSVTREVMATCPDDMAFFEERVEKGLIARLNNVLEHPFQRLTYTEAVEILVRDSEAGKVTFEVTPAWGIDLGSEHERYITEKVYGRPVILTNYPKDIKAFYMRRSDTDPRTVEAMDVLVPKIGELIGGSVRETNFELLQERIKEHGLDMDFYLDLRRYGNVPHCGFGLGFERLLGFCTGLGNIRDLIPFPRWPGNAEG